uniref:BAR domain-containing protein n=1 Tax=Meloidogyne hapla TaxID=6305 RepID=A0A1I8B897_MELHA
MDNLDKNEFKEFLIGKKKCENMPKHLQEICEEFKKVFNDIDVEYLNEDSFNEEGFIDKIAEEIKKWGNNMVAEQLAKLLQKAVEDKDNIVKEIEKINPKIREILKSEQDLTCLYERENEIFNECLEDYEAIHKKDKECDAVLQKYRELKEEILNKFSDKPADEYYNEFVEEMKDFYKVLIKGVEEQVKKEALKKEIEKKIQTN